MKILIDDYRNVIGMDVVARTYEAGLFLLRKMPFDELWLDHDLGNKDPILNGRKLLYTILCEESRGAFAHTAPLRIHLVTSNPVGRSNIEQDLVSFDYEKKIENMMEFWVRHEHGI